MSDLTTLRLQGMHYSHIVHSVRQPLSEFQKSAAYVMLLDSDRWGGHKLTSSRSTAMTAPPAGFHSEGIYIRQPIVEALVKD